MTEHTELANIELLCVIVNIGQGGKVLHTARQNGIQGGTIFLGRGTINHKLLRLFAEVRKEVVLMVSIKEIIPQVMGILNSQFQFDKPNHGIAFTTAITTIHGVRSYSSEVPIKCEGDEPMYHLITIIVNKGLADDVIDAAYQAGSKGGTIINARGAGIHETSKVFSMDIVPEKEIVTILAEREQSDQIVSKIRTDLNMDQPGNGIIYIQEVHNTYGLYKS